MSNEKKLTTAFGCPVVDNQNTMTAGPRGPVSGRGLQGLGGQAQRP